METPVSDGMGLNLALFDAIEDSYLCSLPIGCQE